MGMFPAGGNVTFENENIVLNEPRSSLSKGLAAVFEDRRGVGLLLDEPISWNIIFTALQMQNKFLRSYLGGLVKIRDTQAIRECTRYYIDSLEIKCVSENQRVQELSGGNQQKVCLAKAFATRPKLLFVAEPTRGIDVGAKRVVLETLKGYNKKYGTTIVMISSELEELRSVCDRIAIVNEGKIAGILPAVSESAEFGMLMLGKVENGSEGEKAS
jgi:simple sugar transport system ATP-binding protein